MLRLPPFRFLAPTRLGDAARALADEGPAARLVAGGTDLWPNMKRRHQKAETIVSLMRISELRGIESANGSAGRPGADGLRLGATALLDDVARDPRVRQRLPSLARAVASISSPPLRNMATIGGNVCVDTRCTYYNQTEEWRRSIDYCLKEEGTVCWVAPSSPKCWAHSASDSAPVLCALGAEATLVSTEGERRLPLADLYLDDGVDYLVKRPEEILTEIRVPAAAEHPHCASAFWKLRRRGSIDFAVLSVAVALWRDPAGVVTDARVFLGAVASRPAPVAAAAELLVGGRAEPEALAAVARAARKVATPMDNTDFLTAWRGTMVERYAEAALREAAGLEPGRLPPPHPLS